MAQSIAGEEAEARRGLGPWEHPWDGGISLAPHSRRALLGGPDRPQRRRVRGCVNGLLVWSWFLKARPATRGSGWDGGETPCPFLSWTQRCRESDRLALEGHPPCPCRPSRVPHLRALRAHCPAGPHALGGGHEGEVVLVRSTLSLVYPTPRPPLPACVTPASPPSPCATGIARASYVILRSQV